MNVFVNHYGVLEPKDTIWEGIYNYIGLKAPTKVFLCLTEFDAFLVSLVVKEVSGKNIFKSIQSHFKSAEDEIREFLGFNCWSKNPNSISFGLSSSTYPPMYLVEKCVQHWWTFEENLITRAYHLTKVYFPGKENEKAIFDAACKIQYSLWNTRYEAEHGFISPYFTSDPEKLNWARMCETDAAKSLMSFAESSNGQVWPFEDIVITTPKMNF